MKFYLLVQGILFSILGVWCAVKPEGTSEKVGFSLKGAQGFAEFIAVYGGLEFGLGLFFLWSFSSGDSLKAGVCLASCIYLSIALFRTFSLVRYGTDIGAGYYFFLSEILFATWGLILLLRRT